MSEEEERNSQCEAYDTTRQKFKKKTYKAMCAERKRTTASMRHMKIPAKILKTKTYKAMCAERKRTTASMRRRVPMLIRRVLLFPHQVQHVQLHICLVRVAVMCIPVYIFTYTHTHTHTLRYMCV